MEAPARILIVEDESIVAMDIRANLKKLGYEVCGTCTSGEEAVGQAEALRPSIVLMDIRLEGAMDGIEAAQQIRSRTGAPVIFLTAHADDPTVERAKITEPFGYILKPFQPVELRVAIELAMHKHQSEHAPPPDGGMESACMDALEVGDAALSSKIANHLKGLAFPAEVRPESIAALAERCTLKRCRSGEHIVFEGDERTLGFLVLEGRLSLLKTSLSGRELIVEMLLPGELFGLALALEKQPYTFSARAQRNTLLLLVPRSAVVKFLENEAELYRAFVDLLGRRLDRAYGLSRALAHDKVEVRIASGLLACLPEEVVEAEPEPVVRITRKELAEAAGTTVETAIRVTRALEEGGVLDLSSNGAVRILDRNALEELAGSA